MINNDINSWHDKIRFRIQFDKKKELLQGCLKDKSGVGIIVDYSRDYCCEWCVVLYPIFFSFNLRNFIFQSATKCEVTSFTITSLHVDLNEAAKCVDIFSIHIANLLNARLHTLVQNTKWRRYLA